MTTDPPSIIQNNAETVLVLRVFYRQSCIVMIWSQYQLRTRWLYIVAVLEPTNCSKVICVWFYCLQTFYVPVRFKTSEGSVKSIPEKIVFDKAFPVSTSPTFYPCVNTDVFCIWWLVFYNKYSAYQDKVHHLTFCLHTVCINLPSKD